MRVHWRELFTSKVNAAVQWDRWDLVALVLALATVAWVFALKLKTFYELGYTSDLFVSVQLARSWLEGRRVLTANCFGNMLALHTYFFLLPLGLIAKPFGAPGLLFALAASVGAAYFWAARVLRLLGVAGRFAIIFAGAVLISPLWVAFYQEPHYGFHVEVLTPTLCLILFYFLLQQRLVPSIVTALVVISVKEDASIAAAMVAIVAGVEVWLTSAGKQPPDRLNRPALIVLLLSALAIPALLAISRSQLPPAYAYYSLHRVRLVAPGTLSGTGALFTFVISNAPSWLGSSVIRQWLLVMFVGSFGTILLRPYYLVPGAATTLVAWLVNSDDLLWAPRFYPTETLLWCVTLVGFASIARAVTLETRSHRKHATPISFVPIALTHRWSGNKPTRCLRATAAKANPRNRLLPQPCFSAMRTIETSSGSTDWVAGLRPFGFLAIAMTITSLSGSAQTEYMPTPESEWKTTRSLTAGAVSFCSKRKAS